MKRAAGGSYDLLLILVTIASVGAFWLAILDALAPRSAATPVYYTIAFFVAVSSAILFALFLAADLWLMLGEGGLAERLTRAAFLSLGPCIALVMGYVYSSLRAFEWRDLEYRVVGMLSLRLCVWFAALAWGQCLRFFVKGRLIGPTPGKPRSREMQTSIADIMTLTAFAAAIIVCARLWFHGHTPGRLIDFMGTLTMMAALEVTILVVVLKTPFLMSFGSAWSRQHILRVVTIWTVVCGLITATLTFLILTVVEGWRDAAMAAGTMLALTASICLAVALVLWSFVRAGFRIRAENENDEEEDTQPAGTARLKLREEKVGNRRLSLSVIVFCLVLVIANNAAPYFIDLSELVRSGSVRQAIDFAWLHREEDVWFRRTGQVGAQLIRPAKGEFNLSGSNEKLRRMMRGLVPANVNTLAIQLKGETTTEPHVKVSSELLDDIASRQINVLQLYFHTADRADFEKFCQRATVSEVHGLSPDPANYEALKLIRGLQLVKVPASVPWNPEWQRVMVGLPIQRLRIKLQDSELGDVRGIASLAELQIEDSTITEGVVLQLNELNIDRLTLTNCTMDLAAAKAFGDSKLPQLKLNGTTSIDEEVLLALAANTPRTQIEVVVELDNPLFAVKLQNRFANPFSTFVRGYNSFFSEQEVMETIVRRLSAGADALDLLEEFATIRRNEQNQIVDLDAAGVSISWVDFSSTEFAELARLRMVGQPTRSLLRQIGKLRSLEVLEIAKGEIRPSEFALICQIKQLRRLQLPLAYGHWLTMHPERVPIQWNSYHDTQQIAAQIVRLHNANSRVEEIPTAEEVLWKYDYDGFYEPTPIDSEDFRAIEHAQQLEYLFIPGHLLNRNTFPIFKRLPNLRELHAVFSVVDSGLLKQLAELKQIEKLSIGMERVQPASIAELKKFPNLTQLQIVIFDSNLIGIPQTRVRKALETALPNCDVHLVFFDSLPTP